MTAPIPHPAQPYVTLLSQRFSTAAPAATNTPQEKERREREVREEKRDGERERRMSEELEMERGE